MNMNWLESLIYGLFSGISEFLPISSPAHQKILLHLFGIDMRDPVRDFFVHIAMLIAVVTSCRSILDLIKRETASGHRSRRASQQNFRAFHDWRLIRGATFPMLISMLFLRFVFKQSDSLLIPVIFLAVNGIILFLSERIVHGNKDARAMSALDGFLIGCSGALSVFCGISRVACTYSVSVARGAAKKHALTWSLILSISAIACLCFIDLISVFTVGASGFGRSFHTYIFSGLASYLGSYISISVMRFLTARPSNSGFAYYCWGASLFSFIMYLTVS